jgi:hypothetical protein
VARAKWRTTTTRCRARTKSSVCTVCSARATARACFDTLQRPRLGFCCAQTLARAVWISSASALRCRWIRQTI